MMGYTLAISLLITFFVNLWLTGLANIDRLFQMPKTKPGRMLLYSWTVAYVVLAIMYLWLDIEFSWFLVIAVGGMIIRQVYEICLKLQKPRLQT